MVVIVIDDDIEMERLKKARLIHYIFVKEQFSNKEYGFILMKLIFQREQFINNQLVDVSDY